MKKQQLFLTTPCNTLSYGMVASYIVDSIYKDRELLIFPIGPVSSPSFQMIKGLDNSINVIPDLNANSLRIYHQFDLGHHIGRGKHVGLPFFELDEFSPLEIAHIGMNDVIICPSKWAKSIVDKYHKDKGVVVPMGVDTDLFKPVPGMKSNKCIFLNIGKLEKRKGHDILVQAAEKVFKGKDDVALWMMASNKFIDAVSFNKFVSDCRIKLGNKVAFLPEVKSNSEVASIMNRANFGVYPYLAEGWCMPLLESMSCGLKVIATNYSAPTEYINEDNCILLEPRGMEKAEDGVFFDGSKGNWAKLDQKSVDDLAERMDYCYNLWKQDNQAIDNNARLTAEKFTWKRTGEELLKHV